MVLAGLGDIVLALDVSLIAWIAQVVWVIFFCRNVIVCATVR